MNTEKEVAATAEYMRQRTDAFAEAQERLRRKETMATTQDRVNRVATGDRIDGTTIYWDKQDALRGWPAYRDGYESGSLEFAGWAGPTDGTEEDTYQLAAYFDGDGRYKGPDQLGVYPTFTV